MKKIFFTADVKTYRIFEGLNRSLAQSSVEIFLPKNMCKLLDFCITHQNRRC